MDRGLWNQDSGPCRATRGTSHRFPNGLPMVGRAGPHDAQDGGDEQGGEGHVGADEGRGEGGGHDVKGGRGGRGVRTATRGPVRAQSTRAARQSVQTQAWASVMRRLPPPCCPTWTPC